MDEVEEYRNLMLEASGSSSDQEKNDYFNKLTLSIMNEYKKKKDAYKRPLKPFIKDTSLFIPIALRQIDYFNSMEKLNIPDITGKMSTISAPKVTERLTTYFYILCLTMKVHGQTMVINTAISKVKNDETFKKWDKPKSHYVQPGDNSDKIANEVIADIASRYNELRVKYHKFDFK